jgi:ubiquinone/menaquinone biosynthesis C-methylase UbiE
VSDGFQLEGPGPHAYERYLVPAFFGPCARELLGLAAPAAGERVLDLACGTGVVARRLAARVGATGAVVGVDVNDQMVAFAAAAPAHPTGPAQAAVEWHVADAAALPLGDAAVDLVCCQQGLQFFHDRAGALAEAHRVLVPDGRIALAVWRPIEHNPAFAVFADALQRHAGAEAAAMMRAPFAGPDREQLRQLLVDASFAAVRIRIASLLVRFPSPREFLRQQVVSSPLAGPVGALDPPHLAALADEVDRVLAPYLDDDGTALPMQTWLISARRHGTCAG